MDITQGLAGWHRADGSELPGAVYFRLQEVDGRLRMTELYVDGRGEAIASGSLRRFPVSMLEQAAAQMPNASAKLDAPGPDLSRLAAHFATTFTKAAHWVAESFWAQVAGSGVPQAPMPKGRPHHTSEPEEITLSAPEDGRLSDEFLRQVARAYMAAVAQRQPPANALAAAAGVSPRTVHRWVYTARRRAIMPPATSRGRIV